MGTPSRAPGGVYRTPAPSSPSDDGPGTIVLSMRQVARQVGYCALYEFEDVVAELLPARVVAPAAFDVRDLSRRLYRCVHALSRSTRLASALTPTLVALPAQGRAELFFAIFNHPHELFALNTVREWRSSSRVAICYLCEAWAHRLPDYLLHLLGDFDHVFVGIKASTDAVARITGRPCTYLPMGVDALRFSPYPDEPPRSIDVCGIGRRSSVTHAALLKLAQDSGRFYFYDTIELGGGGARGQLTFQVSDHREHRLLLASLLKRSRYFIANRAWADRPALTGGMDEIAARFYEGAAAGAIMLGDPPNSDEFRRQFEWPGAVVPMPFDSPGVADVIARLEADPARCSGIRRENVVNSLLRHDWAYRLRAMLEAVGIAPTAGMLAREERLKSEADSIRGHLPR